MRWEFSALAEGRLIFGRRPKPRVTIILDGNRARKVSGTQGSNLLALVVEKMDSAIHRINRYLSDKY